MCEYNAKVQEGNIDGGNIEMPIREVIAELVSSYTSIAQDDCFKALRATDDPMIEAIKQLTFSTIRVKEGKTDDEHKVPISSIEDTEKPIDLIKLNKFVEGGIGKDKGWYFIIEQFNYLLTAQKAIDLGIKPDTVHSSYAMKEISRSIDLGKTPTSKTNLLKTLQRVITAMIGEEYKATSHDVNFLMSVYSKKGKKALAVACANHRFFTGYIAEICHKIVLDKEYSVEFKTAK